MFILPLLFISRYIHIKILEHKFFISQYSDKKSKIFNLDLQFTGVRHEIYASFALKTCSQYSELRKLLVFQDRYFKVQKVISMIKTPNDCQIKTCQSLNRGIL